MLFQSSDVTINSLVPPSNGAFMFEVNVKDVQIGAGATEANLATVFDVQGASSLDARSFSSDNVTVSLGVSANGKLTVSASPKVAHGSFFVRVRMYADADTGGEGEPVEPVSTTVTVTFDANGGSGGTSRTVVAGGPVGELPTVTRTGYAFGNWWTAANGGAQVSAHTVVTNDVTYYAHWTANTYEVTYKPGANGSGAQQTATKTHGVALTLRDETFTRSGYAQTGWATSDGGEKAYDLGASYVADAAVTLYPFWTVVDTHGKVQLWKDGPYWAETNIGAEEPWEYGYYFWWGDVVGYKRENNAWVATDGSSSSFSFGASNAPTYNKSQATLQSQGWITADGVLAPEHDAAHVQWGGSWRMPTSQELNDINSNCDWTWATTNGVNGYIVRGKGNYASSSIFLPAAGYGNGTSLSQASSYGDYWSSVPDSGNNNSKNLYFLSRRHLANGNCRYYGFTVRPVQGFTE